MDKFSHANILSRWWPTPYSPEICTQSDSPPPFEHNDFDQCSLIVDTSHLVFRLIIASPSVHTTNCSVKWAWSFKFQGHTYTSGITEARIVKFLTQVGYQMLPKGRHTVQVAQLSLTNPCDALHHDKRQNFKIVT